MIRTIGRVIRGEGFPSALRRANERIGDAFHAVALRARGTFSGTAQAHILNVAASGLATRLGGVQTQLAARLQAERSLRHVALLEPGVLQLSAPHPHSRRVAEDLEEGIRQALRITGASTVHFEGTYAVPLPVMARLIESGLDVVVSVHDFSLFCARPALIEEPMGQFCFYSHDLDRCLRCLRHTWDVDENAQSERRTLARQILASARSVIFPSQFLLDQHRRLFSLPQLEGEIIEPGVPPFPAQAGKPRAIAFAGAAKHHKGAHLLPELARLIGNVELHVFGGGDEDLLRAMRETPNIIIHGYYRSGELPTLLARHEIGLLIFPSIWPESYSLVLSEAWLAGAVVAAFDLGAPAERIRRHGGGWLAPLESGAAGLAEIAEQWLAGQITASAPRSIASPADAARQYADVYRR